MSGENTAMVPRRATDLSRAESPTIEREQVELIKQTICRGATDQELQLFVATANRLRLDPFARQIFSVARWDAELGAMARQTQVSIDGLRLIAERTGEYLPAEELPEFRYNGKGDLLAAVVSVRKFRGGAWHRIPAIAFFDEYAGRKKNGELTRMWADKPHIMLAKCAEALAIRKAFPQETSDAYTPEEMGEVIDVDANPPPRITAPPAPPAVTRAAAPMPAAAQRAAPVARRTSDDPTSPATAAPRPSPVPPDPNHGPSPATQARFEAAAAADRAGAATKPMRPAAAPPAQDAGPDPRRVAPAADEGEAAFDRMVDPAPNAKLDDLPPAPAGENDAQGTPSVVDQVAGELGMATSKAELAPLYARMQPLSVADKDWLVPFYAEALARTIDQGPAEDLDWAFATLGKLRARVDLSVMDVSTRRYKARKAAP